MHVVLAMWFGKGAKTDGKQPYVQVGYGKPGLKGGGQPALCAMYDRSTKREIEPKAQIEHAPFCQNSFSASAWGAHSCSYIAYDRLAATCLLELYPRTLASPRKNCFATGEALTFSVSHDRGGGAFENLRGASGTAAEALGGTCFR